MKKMIVVLAALMMAVNLSALAADEGSGKQNKPNTIGDLLREASKEVAAAQELYAESKSSSGDAAYKHIQKAQELLAAADATESDKGRVKNREKMRGDGACHAVITFVCRWDDGHEYCERASEWICD